MPLLKLNRINKGGEIFINSDQIRFIEIETGSSTVNMGPGNVYAVQETPEVIADKIEELHTKRIRDAIVSSGLVDKKTEII
ncbi:MAG TPA: flagellar FlbD family protein [Verrucomicrobiae bacterium]|nr:flagellar FlbD family protein [Verrucomicrobiae bacterium]